MDTSPTIQSVHERHGWHSKPSLRVYTTVVLVLVGGQLHYS